MKKLLWVLVLLVALFAVLYWLKVVRSEPLQTDSIERTFRYGSLGTEKVEGLPYWVWMVLPRMFPEYLPEPGGYAAVGAGWEPGTELPVGFSKRKIGYDRVSINCAACHADPAVETGELEIYGKANGHVLDMQAYTKFLIDCANDRRFNAENIMAQIGQIHKMSKIDGFFYRNFAIPAARKNLQHRNQHLDGLIEGHHWGDKIPKETLDKLNDYLQ